MEAQPGGPGRFFADHAVPYRVSLGTAGAVALYSAWRAVRMPPGPRRAAWLALAAWQIVVTVGIKRVRDRAVT